MSAFDSAMLMIEDLSTQVTELSKHIWELQLAIWHSHLDPRDGICGIRSPSNWANESHLDVWRTASTPFLLGIGRYLRWIHP